MGASQVHDAHTLAHLSLAKNPREQGMLLNPDKACGMPDSQLPEQTGFYKP
jgi:hypothetical protein